jgi:Tol biopolymer transport system component
LLPSSSGALGTRRFCGVAETNVRACGALRVSPPAGDARLPIDIERARAVGFHGRLYTSGLGAKTVAAAAVLFGAFLLFPGCGGRSAGEWKIVVVAFRDGDESIYVVDQRGGAPVRIAATGEPTFGEPPVPSPDGRRLVLATRSYRLVVMNADGTGRKRLAAGDPSSAVWSPDGKRIVFRGLSAGLSIIGADGKGGRRLTRASEDAEPAWSPDGERVAFARSGSGLMVVDRDGSDLRVLRRLRGDTAQLHWSRDGRSLTFLQRPRPETAFARSDLVTVSVARGRLLGPVPRVGVEFGRIAWSPDGRQLAYERSSRIVVMKSDGSGRRFIAGGRDPVWSPDGRRIVFLAEEPPGGGQLRSIRPDGTGMRRLTSSYPNGVEPLAPGWLRGRFKPRPSPYRLVISPRRDGAALRTHFPVALLAASGRRVALVSPERVWAPAWVSTPPLVLWDARRGRTDRLALPGCHQPQSVAVLDDRLAFECPSGHAASFGRSIRVFPTAGRRPFEIAGGVVGDGLPPARLPGRLAGRSDLLVFSSYRVDGRDVPPEPRLWREQGGGTTLVARGPDAGEPAAVDGGRIAVERKDGQIALLRRDGRVLGRIAPGGRPPSLGPSFGYSELDRPTVGLAGRDLVVLRTGRLLVYDTRTFHLRRSWRVDRDATLAGVAAGLIAYVVGADVHVLRLRDGRSTTIRTTSRSALEASITSAGLFYALHTRPMPRPQLAPFRPNPATVVFVRRTAILRRLR